MRLHGGLPPCLSVDASTEDPLYVDLSRLTECFLLMFFFLHSFFSSFRSNRSSHAFSLATLSVMQPPSFLTFFQRTDRLHSTMTGLVTLSALMLIERESEHAAEGFYFSEQGRQMLRLAQPASKPHASNHLPLSFLSSSIDACMDGWMHGTFLLWLREAESKSGHFFLSRRSNTISVCETELRLSLNVSPNPQCLHGALYVLCRRERERERERERGSNR
mmetsp:Transcript_48800/g.96259  ORF Transcript_48800/g.96259 Transcript_48800/m.96259 type:complete len:219 (-) Transcript_48800:204-860(-)